MTEGSDGGVTPSWNKQTKEERDEKKMRKYDEPGVDWTRKRRAAGGGNEGAESEKQA